MSGFIGVLLAAAAGGFTPVTNTYTTGTGATETIPAGATNCVVEVWGPSGNGGTGIGSGCAGRSGGGGGSGGYSRTSLAVTAGNTFTYTAGVVVSTNSSVSSGTQTISTMTSNFGVAGGNAVGSVNGSGGAGGTASGGTGTNTTGNAGSAGIGCINGVGGAGIVGTNGTGGAGGTGGFTVSNTGRTLGVAGKIIFAYT